MKNKLLLIFVITIALFQQKIVAQSLPLPQESTAEAPVWYFIQTVGDGSSRENRVFTAKGDFVYGADLDKSNEAQLFRFEKKGSGYLIISKSANKQVSVGLNGTEESLSLSNPGLVFQLDPIATYFYQIKSPQAVAGGDAGKLWAHQSNSNSSYKIILTNTSYNTALNSQFSFIPYEDMNLDYSSTEGVWYSIDCADNTAGKTESMTAVPNGETDLKLAIEEFDVKNDRQLWKLVADGSKVRFVNKASGLCIQTRSVVSEENIQYNYTQIADENASAGSWTLTHIRAGQYAISGVEEDGITRYLSATSQGEAPAAFDPSNLIYSPFAWKLRKISSNGTSVPRIKTDEDFRVYSQNRRIVVEGAETFSVRTIQGILVDGGEELPQGVYLVTVQGKTKKILVK